MSLTPTRRFSRVPARARRRLAAGVLAILATIAGGFAPGSADGAGAGPIQLPVPERQGSEIGPWGELRFREIWLEPSQQTLAAYFEHRDWERPLAWTFAGTREEFGALLRKAGVAEDTAKGVLESVAPAQPGEPLRFFPHPALARSLRAEQRAVLYPALGLPGMPDRMSDPFRLKLGGFRRMAQADSGLSRASIRAVERLTWVDASGSPVFSDFDLALADARNDEERRRLLGTLYRESSLHAWLDFGRPGESADDPPASPPLAVQLEYWSAGGKNRSVEGIGSELLFQSTGRLDLLQLLPPLPRRRLHTFPSPEEGVGKAVPDCFSTAFSFFSDTTPNRYYETIIPVFNTRYEPAAPPWQFGDVIVFTDEQGRMLHACNHIAGSVVFTKNGAHLRRPWVLQHLDEVLAEYRQEQGIRMTHYRLKAEFRE